MLFDRKTLVILVSVLAFAIMYSVFDSEGGVTGKQIAIPETAGNVFIGADRYDGFAGPDSGRVYIYSYVSGRLQNNLYGENAGDRFGASIAKFGNKYAVGAPYHDGPNGIDSGKLYIYTADGQLLTTIDGLVASYFGTSIAGIGDVNGDGFEDLAVGSNLYDAGPNGANAGILKIYSGRGTFPEIFSLDGGNTGDQFGYAFAGIGDVNGDGVEDFSVSAPGDDGPNGANAGKVYMYNGVNANLIYYVEGDAPNEMYGAVVENVGDIDSDGVEDFSVSAPLSNGPCSVCGEVYLYSGLTGNLLYKLFGQQIGAGFGYAVAGIGDVNRNGVEDFAVSEKHWDGPGGFDAGRVSIYDGSGTSLNILDGEATSDWYGWSLSALDDHHIVIGAPLYDNPSLGKAYMIDTRTMLGRRVWVGDMNSFFGVAVA